MIPCSTLRGDHALLTSVFEEPESLLDDFDADFSESEVSEVGGDEPGDPGADDRDTHLARGPMPHAAAS